MNSSSNIEFTSWNNFYKLSKWYDNQTFYGKVLKICKEKLHKINYLLAVIIPVVYPIAIVPFVNRYIFKKDIKIKYGD